MLATCEEHGYDDRHWVQAFPRRPTQRTLADLVASTIDL
jgi:hypothetical protein